MKTRKCRKCGGVYTLDKFVKHKTSLFGRLHKCKKCHNKACRSRTGACSQRIYYKNNKTKCNMYYEKSKKKRFTEKPWLKYLMYARKRCLYKKSRYHARGIKFKLTQKDIEFIWKRDKAYLLSRPSIDRIKGSGNYELSNCRFIEWIDNCKR